MFNNGLPTYAYHQMHRTQDRVGLGADDTAMPEEYRQALENEIIEDMVTESLVQRIGLTRIVAVSGFVGFLLGLAFPYAVKEIDKRM